MLPNFRAVFPSRFNYNCLAFSGINEEPFVIYSNELYEQLENLNNEGKRLVMLIQELYTYS